MFQLYVTEFQDSGGRDLKSAQNTPSRQPLAQPTNTMAPPPLHQDNRQSVLAGGDFKKVIMKKLFLDLDIFTKCLICNV